MRNRSSRDGYARVLVLIFIALMLCMYSVAYRHVAAALRIETARTLLKQRDEGSVHALAGGVTLLETGMPPSDPYVCAVIIGTSPNERSFTVTFVSEGGNAWSVSAAPTQWPDEPQAMPATFATGS